MICILPSDTTLQTLNQRGKTSNYPSLNDSQPEMIWLHSYSMNRHDDVILLSFPDSKLSTDLLFITVIDQINSAELFKYTASNTAPNQTRNIALYQWFYLFP